MGHHVIEIIVLEALPPIVNSRDVIYIDSNLSNKQAPPCTTQPSTQTASASSPK